MKIIVPISLFLAIVAIALPYFAASGEESSVGGENSGAPPTESAAAPSASTAPTANKLADYGLGAGRDAATTIRLSTDDEVVELPLSDYLVGVVAAEMPVTFYDEAIKAQAVAARTYSLYRMSRPDDGMHPNADLCDNAAHCEAWLSDAELRERWGSAYSSNLAKITAAVAATDGLCAVYDGQPILAVFHSSAGGFTEDSGHVWGESLPYLQSVQSPESATSVPDFVTEVAFSLDEFKRTALSAYPAMTLSGSPETWFSGVVRSDSGRVVSATLGGVNLSGTQLRVLFGLRSANAMWTLSDSEVRFTVRGYGHGVGLSQFGANEFARNGASFEDILKYFYNGVSIEVVGSRL